MQSNNPVFARNDNFNGRAGSSYTDPSQWQINLDGATPTDRPVSSGRMTIDTVVEKTAITLGLVVLAAAATWFVIGNVVDDSTAAINSAAVAKAGMLAMGGAIIGFILSMVNSFKKVVSPALVMAYAVVEGVFVGAFSKLISLWAGVTNGSLVMQAVIATFIAAGATLAAYKFFNIQVTARFRRVVTISLFAFMGVMIVNWILSMFGVFGNGGLRSMDNPLLAVIVSGIAVTLGVLCLIMDFDYVENGVRAGLPERESWRAAFGLTVTLVWLYLELLRLIAILRGNN